VLPRLTVIIAGIVAVTAVVWQDGIDRDPVMDWTVFGVIAVLLVGCERLPRSWTEVGPNAAQTPLWLFALALLLLAAPGEAIGVALVGASINACRHERHFAAIVERLAATGLSLAAGAIVLSRFGVQGQISEFERMPWTGALGIVGASLAIVATNAAVATVLTAIPQRRSLPASFRREFAIRTTSEGALLSLAPVWVIGLELSPVMIALLGVTTVLVFRSTKEALERNHQANHDVLTGLPNRRAFLDQLDDAIATAKPGTLAVLLMDLDGFKDVNDRLGHPVGDALLVAFAERLRRSLPARALPARLGGDEFAVLLTAAGDVEARDRLVHVLRRRLSEPLTIGEFPISVDASIGIAVAPTDGATSADLVHSADIAMYRAKRRGAPEERRRDRSELPKHVQLSLLGDIGDALDRRELEVNFQPQVRLSDGHLDVVEALVRWNHPRHGSIPPMDYIGLAEQTDLIEPITLTVLREASLGLLQTGAPSTRLAVNVSARSLQETRFAESMLQVLEETRFPPDRLELEVNERALVRDPERCVPAIDELRASGVRIAIDDFGGGNSSYQTLRAVSIDRVKIDRDVVIGAVGDLRDRKIVTSLIDLAHALGLEVVGEGVENQELYELLGALGCDAAQGFHIAVPMSAGELRSWIPAWHLGSRRFPLRLVP
jgi:diguanylate cyclase (GGDEF)-like protein